MATSDTVLPLEVESTITSSVAWDDAISADANEAIARHMASLVNNKQWADVEFVLEADGKKRVYAFVAAVHPIQHWRALLQQLIQ